LVGKSNIGSSICVLLLNLLTINPTYSTHSWPLEVTRVSLYSRNCHRVGIWCSCSLRHSTPSSMSIRVTSIIGLTYTSTLWSISCISVRGCLLRQALTWNCRGPKGLLLLLLLGVWNWACSQKLWISYNLFFRCYNLHVQNDDDPAKQHIILLMLLCTLCIRQPNIMGQGETIPQH
jgi:hypothetical protein